MYDNTWEGIGRFGPCSNNAHIQLEVCLQQLLGNGWNVIWWSCQTTTCGFSDAQCGGFSNWPSHWVGLTTGRWYDTWQWGYINGESGAYSRTWDGVLG